MWWGCSVSVFGSTPLRSLEDLERVEEGANESARQSNAGWRVRGGDDVEEESGDWASAPGTREGSMPEVECRRARARGAGWEVARAAAKEAMEVGCLGRGRGGRDDVEGFGAREAEARREAMGGWVREGGSRASESVASFPVSSACSGIWT